MTEPALVSAQPWSHLEARDGLLDRATVATATVGSLRVRVIPEPLKTVRDGVAVQSVRLLFDGEHDDQATGERGRQTTGATGDDPSAVTATLAGPDGVDRVVGRAPAPDTTSVRLLVRTVDEPTDVTLTVARTETGTDISFVLLPQRDWSVHVVHHSHFDFGYTDPQTTVISSQRSYLDSAVELAAATRDWP